MSETPVNLLNKYTRYMKNTTIYLTFYYFTASILIVAQLIDNIVRDVLKVVDDYHILEHALHVQL